MKGKRDPQIIVRLVDGPHKGMSYHREPPPPDQVYLEHPEHPGRPVAYRRMTQAKDRSWVYMQVT